MCGIVGLLDQERGAARPAGRTDGADARRHDRPRSRFRRPRRIHAAVVGGGAQAEPVQRRARGRFQAAARRIFAPRWMAYRASPLKGNHAVLITRGDPDEAADWVSRRAPDVAVLSVGRSIDLYKDVGAPADIARRYRFEDLEGTHLVAHTRMATESAVTPAHAHPFTAGRDFCLVHNGSLSNPHLVRKRLEPLGIKFETDNDTEAACRFFEWRLREGDDLETAVERGFSVLDGFYTFLMGTETGAAHRARCVRLQAGRRRRERRLRRHRIGVPLARAPAGHRERLAVRAQAGGNLQMANLKPVPASARIRPRAGHAARAQSVPAQAGRPRRRVADRRAQSGRRAFHRLRPRRRARRAHSRPRGLLRRRHEQACPVTVHGNAGPGAAENMMSGRVHVKGFASVAAGASAHGGLLIVDGDASLRCGISLKGADIVVGGSVGSFSAFMAQAGRMVICGDAGDALGRLALRGSHLCARQGAIARRRRALRADERGGPIGGEDPAGRRRAHARPAANSSAWLRRRACITGMPKPTRSTERCQRHASARSELGGESPFDRATIDYIQRAAASGLYEIRGLGAKRRVPSFDDLLFLAASLSRYPLEGYRERCATKTVLGTRFASRPIELAHPDDHRRHELRGAVGQGQGGARPRGHRARAPRPRPAMAA